MSDEFDDLLVETGITFVPQAGFSACPVNEASRFRYQRAYRHPAGAEVRYRIDSLQRLKAEFGGSLPENFSVTAFASTLANLSGGQAGKTTTFDARQARDFFGADWVSYAYFRPVDPQFAGGYDIGVLYYFHREGVADVNLIGLFKEDSDGAALLRGQEPPVRFRGMPESQPDPRAAFRATWDQACALVDGCVNLDGRALPPPDAAERSRLEEAIPLFNQAARMEPNNAGPMLFAAKVHERLGDLPASLAALRQAHAIAPDNTVLIIELGAALGRCGLHEQAIATLSHGTAMHPTEARLHCNLGLALLMSGDAPRAIKSFEQLVGLEPQSPQNKRLLALAVEVANGRKPVPKTAREVDALM